MCALSTTRRGGKVAILSDSVRLYASGRVVSEDCPRAVTFLEMFVGAHGASARVPFRLAGEDRVHDAADVLAVVQSGSKRSADRALVRRLCKSVFSLSPSTISCSQRGSPRRALSARAGPRRTAHCVLPVSRALRGGGGNRSTLERRARNGFRRCDYGRGLARPALAFEQPAHVQDLHDLGDPTPCSRWARRRAPARNRPSLAEVARSPRAPACARRRAGPRAVSLPASRVPAGSSPATIMERRRFVDRVAELLPVCRSSPHFAWSPPCPAPARAPWDTALRSHAAAAADRIWECINRKFGIHGRKPGSRVSRPGGSRSGFVPLTGRRPASIQARTARADRRGEGRGSGLATPSRVASRHRPAVPARNANRYPRPRPHAISRRRSRHRDALAPPPAANGARPDAAPQEAYYAARGDDRHARSSRPAAGSPRTPWRQLLGPRAHAGARGDAAGLALRGQPAHPAARGRDRTSENRPFRISSSLIEVRRGIRAHPRRPRRPASPTRRRRPASARRPRRAFRGGRAVGNGRRDLHRRRQGISNRRWSRLTCAEQIRRSGRWRRSRRRRGGFWFLELPQVRRSHPRQPPARGGLRGGRRGVTSAARRRPPRTR